MLATKTGLDRLVRPTATALLGSLAVISLASCGSSGGDPESSAADAVATYLFGLADGDGRRACSVLDPGMQGAAISSAVRVKQGELGSMERDRCEVAIETLSASLTSQEQEALRGSQPVSVGKGDGRAEVTLEGGDRTATVVRKDGRWIIEAGLTDEVVERAEPDSEVSESEQAAPATSLESILQDAGLPHAPGGHVPADVAIAPISTAQTGDEGAVSVELYADAKAAESATRAYREALARPEGGKAAAVGPVLVFVSTGASDGLTARERRDFQAVVAALRSRLGS